MMQSIRSRLAGWGRFFFVLLVGAGAFVFAMFQGGIVSWTIFYAILPFILYSVMLFFYPLKNFRGNRKLQTSTIQNGEHIVVSVSVERNFPFPLLYTVLSDEWKEESSLKRICQVKKFVVFGWSRSFTWDYKVENMPRGEHIAPNIKVEVTDFFGWIRKSILIPQKNSVLVFPRTMNVNFVPLETRPDGGLTTSPFNLVKETTMVTGLRDYQFGDRMSWIHWKSFARTQTLMTKEFEDRNTQDLLLILDGRKTNTFEAQVEFAASIIKEATYDKSNISFLPIERTPRFFSALQTASHLKAVLTYLAKIQPMDEEKTELFPEAKKALEKAGGIVIITAVPSWKFLAPIVTNVSGGRSIFCFVVLEDYSSLDKKLVEDIKYAKSKGIIVHPVVRKQFSEAFSEAFNEVSRL